MDEVTGPPSRLDLRSRRTVVDCGAHVGVYAALTTLVWLIASGGALAEFLGIFRTLCAVGAVGASCAALRRRERINGETLNHWDQGMALNALSLLAHMAQRSLS